MQGFRLSSVFWALLGHVADRGAIFLVSALLARTLSAEDFSRFGFFLMTITTLAAFSTLGAGVSASRMFARWRSGDVTSSGGILPLWVGCMAIGAFVGVVSAVLVRYWHPDPPYFSPALHISAVVAISLGVVPHGGMLGCGFFRASSLVAGVSALVVLLGGYAGSVKGDVELAQVSLVLSYWISSLLVAFAIVRTLPQLGSASLGSIRNAESWRAISSVGPLAMASVLAVSANWLAGRLLLQKDLMPEAEFSAFILGLQWFGIVQLVPSMITKAAFPSLAGASNEERVGWRRVLWRSAFWSVGSATMTAAMIFAMSGLLTQFYDGGIGARELVAFSVAAIPGSCANAIGNAIVAIGKSRTWLLITVCWFMTFVVLSVLSVRMGALGIAASLGISGVVMTSLAIVAAKSSRLE